MRNIMSYLIMILLICGVLTSCLKQTPDEMQSNDSETQTNSEYYSDTSELTNSEPTPETDEITSKESETESEIKSETESENEDLPPADSNLGGLLDEIPPENKYLSDYFNKLDDLMTEWQESGEYNIVKFHGLLEWPRYDIVVPTEEDADAVKEKLISMGDFDENIPYYKEDIVLITVGEHFPDDER